MEFIFQACQYDSLMKESFTDSKNSEEVNQLCWKPNIQEAKDSQYAADNIRYQWQLKKQMVEEFKILYNKYFNINNIRYIF